MAKQKTITVNGEKIRIKSRKRTMVGNFAGYHVWINNDQQHVSVMNRQEAEDIAFVNWVKKNK